MLTLCVCGLLAGATFLMLALSVICSAPSKAAQECRTLIAEQLNKKSTRRQLDLGAIDKQGRSIAHIVFSPLTYTSTEKHGRRYRWYMLSTNPAVSLIDDSRKLVAASQLTQSPALCLQQTVDVVHNSAKPLTRRLTDMLLKSTRSDLNKPDAEGQTFVRTCSA